MRAVACRSQCQYSPAGGSVSCYINMRKSSVSVLSMLLRFLHYRRILAGLFREEGSRISNRMHSSDGATDTLLLLHTGSHGLSWEPERDKERERNKRSGKHFHASEGRT